MLWRVYSLGLWRILLCEAFELFYQLKKKKLMIRAKEIIDKMYKRVSDLGKNKNNGEFNIRYQLRLNWDDVSSIFISIQSTARYIFYHFIQIGLFFLDLGLRWLLIIFTCFPHLRPSSFWFRALLLFLSFIYCSLCYGSFSDQITLTDGIIEVWICL